MRVVRAVRLEVVLAVYKVCPAVVLLISLPTRDPDKYSTYPAAAPPVRPYY